MILLLFLSSILGYIVSWLLYKRQQSYSQQIKTKIESICAKKIAKKKNIGEEKTKSIIKEYEHLKKVVSEKYQQNIQSLREQITYQEMELKNREEYLNLKEQLFFDKKSRVQNKIDTFNYLNDKLSDICKEHKKALLKVKKYDIAKIKKYILQNTQRELHGEKQILLNRFADDISMYSEEIVKRLLSSIVQRSVFSHWNDSYPNSLLINDKKTKSFLKDNEHILNELLGVSLQFKDSIVIINESDGYCREIARKVLLDTIQYTIDNSEDLYSCIIQKCEHYKQKTIEFVLKKCEEIDLLDFSKSLAWHMGKLKYRTSFGQNILAHSYEVAMLAWRIAGELGFSQSLSKRGAFLHDIGKAVDHKEAGGHSSLGEQILKDENEASQVIEGIVEHHEDASPEKPYAAIVSISDAISAARPGARRETFEKYTKKLQKIESLTKNIKGIRDAYAVSAGREIRVIVQPDIINDHDAQKIAKELAISIGKEILYSGVVRVTVIREKTFEVYT
ncbi:HD domain-containing protein [Candidatus Uabimicrobium sp. HlEnr_7]|uniref:HD domain-containing protein n=1 Tax=Candidatus Uabimicrobium helgolandensis TaxID=3095367 RepID=UPI0035578248